MKDNKAPGWLSDFGQAAEMERELSRDSETQIPALGLPLPSLGVSLFLSGQVGLYLQNGAPDLDGLKRRSFKLCSLGGQRVRAGPGAGLLQRKSGSV